MIILVPVGRLQSLETLRVPSRVSSQDEAPLHFTRASGPGPPDLRPATIRGGTRRRSPPERARPVEQIGCRRDQGRGDSAAGKVLAYNR